MTIMLAKDPHDRHESHSVQWCQSRRLSFEQGSKVVSESATAAEKLHKGTKTFHVLLFACWR